MYMRILEAVYATRRLLSIFFARDPTQTILDHREEYMQLLGRPFSSSIIMNTLMGDVNPENLVYSY